MSRLHCAATLSFIVAGIVDVTGAQAASVRVGDAVQIVHEVAGRQSDDQAWSSKAEGDDVYENEFIHTAVESQARIVLVDRTGLSVGPITTIRIDRILYNPDQSMKGIVVSAGTGTVRWTSGDAGSYLIKTPTANVTPIGTVFDLFVDFQRTFVILRQGRVKVCTNNLQPTCRILSNPGEMMLATADELQGPGQGGLEPGDFANRCLSATGQNCVMKLTYSPPQPPQREPSVPKTRRAEVQPSRPRVVEEENDMPRRRLPYSTTTRAEVQPSRPRVVEEENDMPRRRLPYSTTTRAEVQPSRPRVVEEEYVVPRPNLPYSTYYRRPYPRAVYTTAGAGYVRRPISGPIYTTAGAGYMRRPISGPIYTTAGAGYVRRRF